MSKLSFTHNFHKKSPLDSLKKSHQKCKDSIKRAKELLEKAREQYLSINSELQQHPVNEQGGFSTPVHWLRRGVTSSLRQRASEAPDAQFPLEYSPPSYLHQVIRKLSRSPPPSASGQELPMVSVNESRQPSRKSVSFAEESTPESVTPTRKEQS